jgi:hypothetical protein
MRIARFLFAVMLAMIFSRAASQNSQVLYFMDLPQNHLLNPALRSSGNLYVGIPGLTGINFNITNNFFSFSDVFTEGMKVSEETLPFLDPAFNAEAFLNRVKETNYLEPQVSVQLLGLGLTTGRDLYLFLDVTERAEANIVFPRDLMRLAFLGNEEFVNQTFDLTALKADIRYYREIGAGFSKKVTPRLRIGAKGKLLFGITSGSYSNETLNLTVNEDLSNRLIADMSVKVSGPLNFYLDPENKIDDIKFDDSRFDSGRSGWQFFTNTKNPGFGLDLGAEYEITPKIVLSASVTDLGFIKWRSDITNLRGHGDANMKGIDFADIRDGSATLDELGENMADSLMNAMTFTDTKEAFATFLPFGVTLAGKYKVTDKFSVGILSYSRIVKKQVREAFTLSANLNLGSVLSACLTYTASSSSYANLGAGLGVRAGFAQIYFLVDRVPLAWSRVNTGNDSFRMPANWNTINGRFGINLVFGNKGSKNREESASSDE